jgi:hypothetical protein
MPMSFYSVNAGQGVKRVTELWSGPGDLPVANWVISKFIVSHIVMKP